MWYDFAMRSTDVQPLTKGQLTRRLILEKTAPVFNQRGFGGTTLDDIKAATGLEKGGIYRHFSGKEQIALEAFDYACSANFGHQYAMMANVDGAMNKLMTFLEGFFAQSHPIPGGCPVFNAAVEHDDGNPLLKKKAQDAYRCLIKTLSELIKASKVDGVVRKDIDSTRAAIFLLSSVEGGLIARNLTGDHAITKTVMAEIEWYLTGKRGRRKRKFK